MNTKKTTARIKLGSLFDGIGGFPYAGSFFGIEPLWASEILPQAVSVTKRHFPAMAHVGDVTKLDGSALPPVDILTSGTLSAGGDFTRTKHTLGIDRVSLALLAETSKSSPFDHNANTLLYLSGRVPFPDNKDKSYIANLTDEIDRLVLASHGHAAVLFTSYNVIGLVFSELQKRRLPFPLFRMGKRDVNALERFRKSGDGILFASGALWEGIDIPGDALSMLIIVKLPFAVPDPIGEYEKTLYGSMDEYKVKALVPDMLVKLKQGFGRLIRTETDTGCAAILDCRAHERGNYHRCVLAALPDCRVTSRLAEVEQFFNEKKSPAYFMPGLHQKSENGGL